MGDGFSFVNCTFIIQKKGSSAINYSADIFEFTESPFEKKKTYTKAIGGIILVNKEAPTEKTISFKYIRNDSSFDQMMGNSIGTTDPDFDTANEYRITLQFYNGSEYYIKSYYNATVVSHNTNIDESVLKGDITFSIPIKDITGNYNYWVGTSTSNLATYNTTMGYSS